MKKKDFYLDDESNAKLEALKEKGFNVSKVIREAIKAYLESNIVKSILKAMDKEAP